MVLFAHKSTMTKTSASASIITISYEDLVAFADTESSNLKSLSDSSLVDSIGAAFGADGLGILVVQNVPNFAEQRKALLPLAAKLPKLPDLDNLVDSESLYSTGWSHGKECLVVDGKASRPDTAKGSFYANPLTDDLVASCIERTPDQAAKWKQLGKEHPDFFAPNLWPHNTLPQLQPAFGDMGRTLHHVGCLLAKVCDAYCRRYGVELKLHETLQRSLNAKGRLLHYFEMDASVESAATTAEGDEDSEAMWCGWHNDHGSLTGLVPAMYLTTAGDQLSGSPDDTAGLYIQSRSGQVVKAVLPGNACAFQIGETSQIQSGGILQATPHAVKPPRQAGITRESFALFMEPEYADPLEIPPSKTLGDVQDVRRPLPASVLPLKARWKSGQTFGEFHHATVSAFTL